MTTPGISASAMFDMAARVVIGASCRMFPRETKKKEELCLTEDRFLVPADGQPANLCVAGETVTCTVAFNNPSAMPIDITVCSSAGARRLQDAQAVNAHR